MGNKWKISLNVSLLDGRLHDFSNILDIMDMLVTSRVYLLPCVILDCNALDEMIF